MVEEKPIDTGDEKQVKERKKAHELVREQEIAELQALLDTYGGRSFLWRLLECCGIYHAGVTDALETFRELGKRDIGLWALDEIFEANSNAYAAMREEAVSRDAKIKKGKTDE